MAAHEKFVLKERQRLQAKEKELEKKEADAAAVKERLAAVEVELKSKSAQKVWPAVAPDLKSDAAGQATYQGNLLKTSAGPLKCASLTDCPIG